MSGGGLFPFLLATVGRRHLRAIEWLNCDFSLSAPPMLLDDALNSETFTEPQLNLNSAQYGLPNEQVV